MALRDELRANSAGELSIREHDVATKFVAGMTYREIGEALFIAPTTVRTHLSAIYQKLGVHNKMALANALIDQRPASTTITAPDELGPPIIAVLPFDNLDTGESWSRLADGLTADLIVDLGRYSDLAVISRYTMLALKGRDDPRSIGRDLRADYLIEGSLQAVSDDRLRVSVQLVDARSGAGVWSARYDKPAADLFAVQESVTGNVINVLAGCCGKLANLRRDIVRRKPPSSMTAYDCYLLGVEQLNFYSRSSTSEAIRLLSRAIELDPALARAWAELGFAYAVEGANAYGDDRARSLENFRRCATRALELDPGNNHARQCVGDFMACTGNFEGAIAENTRALLAAPNDSDILALVAGSRALAAGNPGDGLPLIERALSINALPPAWYYSMLGRVTFVMGRHREAIAAFKRAPQDMPSTWMFVSMAHALLGETEQSKVAGEWLAITHPDFTSEDFLAGYPITNPPAIATIRAGALCAGLAWGLGAPCTSALLNPAFPG